MLTPKEAMALRHMVRALEEERTIGKNNLAPTRGAGGSTFLDEKSVPIRKEPITWPCESRLHIPLSGFGRIDDPDKMARELSRPDQEDEYFQS